MADEPAFPPADQAKAPRPAYRTAGVRPADPVEPTPRRLVVSRAEEPPNSAKPAKKLSPEEIGALLEVGGARQRIPKLLWERGRVIAIPTGLFMMATRLLLGSWAPFFIYGSAVVILIWIALPLFKRDGW